MFLSMTVHSSEGVTPGRGSDPVLTTLFWVVLCSAEGERNKEKGGEGCNSGLAVEREVPRQTPLKRRSQEVAERSLPSAAAPTQLLSMVFFSLLFCLGAGEGRDLFSLLLLGFPGVPCWQEQGGGKAASPRVCLELVTTC